MFSQTKDNCHGLPHDPFKVCLVRRPIGWISTLGRYGVVNLAPRLHRQSPISERRLPESAAALTMKIMFSMWHKRRRIASHCRGRQAVWCTGSMKASRAHRPGQKY